MTFGHGEKWELGVLADTSPKCLRFFFNAIILPHSYPSNFNGFRQCVRPDEERDVGTFVGPVSNSLFPIV